MQAAAIAPKPIVGLVPCNPIGPQAERGGDLEFVNLVSDHQQRLLEDIPGGFAVTRHSQRVPPEPFLPPRQQRLQGGSVPFAASQHEYVIFNWMLVIHS